MTDRPILFSAPMVRALLAARKTQTRRILKPQPGEDGKYTDIKAAKRALKIIPGDRLWVREAWRVEARYDDLKPSALRVGVPVYYEAGDYEATPECAGRLRPGMFMPRWASRLTLTVTGVRVQRLEDISNEDCVAEGVLVHPNKHVPHTGLAIDAFARTMGLISYYGAGYRDIWEVINGRGSWALNPYVAAYTFGTERRNIDESCPERGP